ALAALGHDQLDGVAAMVAAGEAGLQGTGGAVAEGEAGGELAEVMAVDVGGDDGAVALGDPVPRMGESQRQLAVAGEQEQAAGVGVEAADRVETAGVVDEVEDRGAALGIAAGADHALGLVEHQGAQRDGVAEGAAVDGDLVDAGLDQGAGADGGAVDLDPALLDEDV